MMSWVINARSQKCHVVQFKGHCTVTVQPAGPSGMRHVFVTLAGSADDGDAAQEIELVLPECAACRLGEALISGSVGVMREFDLSI
jgi:hypothetical protein